MTRSIYPIQYAAAIASSVELDEYNAGEHVEIPFSLVDQDGEPLTPVSLSFRCLCLDSGAVILDDTPITDLSSGYVALTPDQTQMTLPSALNEVRRIEITATFGVTGDDSISTFDFRLVNPASGG